MDQQVYTYRLTPARGRGDLRDRRDIELMVSSIPVVRGSGAGGGRARFVRVLVAQEDGGNRLVSIDYLAHLVWKVCDM